MSEAEKTQDWMPCVRRNNVTIIDREGQERSSRQCAHTGCDRFTKEVTPADCAACILRVPGRLPIVQLTLPKDQARDFEQPTLLPDGTISYPKTGWEPPKCPDGYKPKSTDPKSPDAWVFIPLAPPCADREMYNGTLPCGCVKIAQVCMSQASGRFATVVSPEICEACPVRRALSEQVQVQ